MKWVYLIVLAVVAVLICALWKKSAGVSKSETADTDKNSLSEEYVLQNGRLTVVENGKAVWQSPKGWWVDDFVLTDSTNDGATEINLSVWKRGSYGTSKPFWVKENDQSFKNHFFVFRLKNGQVQPFWQSSNLDAPNCRFTIKDVDGDGQNELAVIEGKYSIGRFCKGKYYAVWRWNGWGFTNIFRTVL